MSNTVPDKVEPLAIPETCPEFYAFGASYPDGTCHDGHLDDADGDYCTEGMEHIPCPACHNAEYQSYLAGGGRIVYPFGFVKAVSGDYYMPKDESAYAKAVGQ